MDIVSNFWGGGAFEGGKKHDLQLMGHVKELFC